MPHIPFLKSRGDRPVTETDMATETQPTIAIRTCTAADYESVFALYDDVFGKEAGRRFRARWRWQFFDNPACRDAPSEMWVAELDGAIVGFLASFPVRMQLAGRVQLVYHDCDLIVAPQARRGGVGQRLVEAYDAFANPLSNALAYAPANGRIRERVGYRAVHAVPIALRPYNAAAIARYVGVTERLPRGLSPVTHGVTAILGVGFAAANRLRAPRAPADRTVERLSGAGEEIDRLWARCATHFPFAAVRDAAWVQWRFLEDPLYDVTVLAARDGSGAVTGYLAFRVTPRPDLRLGRILDLFALPDDVATVDALLHRALALTRADHADLVSCVGLHPALRRRVHRYLYVKPARLDRPAWLLWKGDPALRERVHDAGEWHISHADSDIGFAP